jgi:hypothetical protein
MALSKPSGPKGSRKGFVLGRERFEKISAVEGIKTSNASRRMFADFERKGLSDEERRAEIFRKHAKRSPR